MAAKNTLFADCATMLLRRALNEGFALTIVVTREGARADGVDLDGCAIKLTSRSSQLALPLEPAVEVAAPVEAAPPCECPALVEAPAVDPMAPGQRVMRVGDLVVERLAHGKTRDWIVTAVGADGPTMHNDGFHETLTWGHISLDAADLWRLSSSHDPVPTAPSRGDGRPVEAPPARGETMADIVAMGAHANAQMAARQALAVGDRILLDGVAVEVLGVDRDGFIWRATDGDDFEEGDVEWSAVRHVAANVWAPRTIVRPDVADEPAAEAAPPAKKTRAKKARAPKAAPSTEPAAPVPHRLQAVTEADELAHHGAHSLIGLLRGEEWCTLATRAKDETAPEWQRRITEASKAVRVRVYDRGAHCTWDSADGNREGYIHGGPA